MRRWDARSALEMWKHISMVVELLARRTFDDERAGGAIDGRPPTLSVEADMVGGRLGIGHQADLAGATQIRAAGGP
jgi:hypothetical protein